MSTVFEHARETDRLHAEQKSLNQITERVTREFPELPAQQIIDAVRGHYAEFEGSRIRDFIPILVERAVRSDLNDHLIT
jgi:hypothetical protein